MTWELILQNIIYPALISCLVAAVSAVAVSVWKLFAGWLATQKHGKASSIVSDSVIGAGEKLRPAFLAAFADGKITEEEWSGIKRLALEIAATRLKELRGFPEARLGKWLEDQVDIAVGKLTGRLLGIDLDTGSDLPESLANSPAAES